MSENTTATTASPETFNSPSIRWERDGDIVILVLDDPNSSVNTMNRDFSISLQSVMDRLESEVPGIAGVIVTSAKKSFFAGGDLNSLKQGSRERATEETENATQLKANMRRLEKLGVPVVAAMAGTALGGGFEIALVTHHRIAVADAHSRYGLPEVTLGLLPGAGGVTRTVRLLGLQRALSEVVLPGTRFSAEDAHAAGLIDELVDSADELIPRAKKWIAENPNAIQPWDDKSYRMPGGSITSPSVLSMLHVLPAMLRKQLKGAPMPAPRAALAAAVEGLRVDFDTALLIETRYLMSLTAGQVAKNMINAFFFDLQKINSGASRPAGFEKRTVKKVAVIGAGMMGAAIAYVSARAGIDVVLKDVSSEAALKGKGYSEKLEQKALQRGKTTPEKSEALLNRIHATSDVADLADVDFVIEAVFESVDLKQQVLREVESVVSHDAVLGSNTSTLPITELSKGVERTADVIGIHFFSPVDKMPLVEIVRGKNTSDETLARAFDFVLQIRKTPIVVSDARGFFTSRVIGCFINEAISAVGEGVEPALIEQAALQAGYPAGPLQLQDELTLSLSLKIRQETENAALAAGEKWEENESGRVLRQLVEDFGRKGRSTGAGFYEYDDTGKRVRLWPGLRDAFGSGSTPLSMKDIQERMLFSEAIDAIRCLDSGVLHSVADANIGSLYGIGFPAWTGGVIQYVNQYEGGLAGFLERTREFEKTYGSRFAPPESLIRKAAAGEYYE